MECQNKIEASTAADGRAQGGLHHESIKRTKHLNKGFISQACSIVLVRSGSFAFAVQVKVAVTKPSELHLITDAMAARQGGHLHFISMPFAHGDQNSSGASITVTGGLLRCREHICTRVDSLDRSEAACAQDGMAPLKMPASRKKTTYKRKVQS